MNFSSKFVGNNRGIRKKGGTPGAFHEKHKSTEIGNNDEDDVEVTSTSGFYGAGHGKNGVITEDDVS